MLVSVIIPAYNREQTICRTVDSVLAQTYGPLEIIVVDDGSKDRTVEVLKKYGERIRLVCQANQGPSAARNTGIRNARGETIMFLDSDDEWLPTKAAVQVALLQQAGASAAGCCICNARMVAADGLERISFDVAGLSPEFAQGIWLNPAEVLLTRFVLFNQTIAIRRQVFEQAGLFDEKYRLLEDYDLALRLALTGPWAYTTEPLVVWHGGAQNSLSSRASELEALVKTDEILGGLQNSTTWADKLPRVILQRQRKFIQRCLRLRHLAGRANGLAAKVARIFLRLDKWIYHRRPAFPRMKVRCL